MKNDTVVYYQTRTAHKMDSEKTQRLLRRRNRYCLRFCRYCLFQSQYGDRYSYQVGRMVLTQLDGLAHCIRQIEQSLMVDNLKLVLYFTGSRFNGRLDGCLSTDDVVQAGCLGLMTAIEQFDITKKTNLSTYASYGIKQSANCEFFEKCCTMRGPRWLLQQIQQIDKNYQDVDWSDPAALQQRFNMTKETAVAACKWHYPCLISLSTPWKRDDKLVNIADVVADFNAISPEKAVIRKGLTEDLTNFLSENLSKRNQKILFGRYANHKTLEELGEELHLTHERVRQLEQHGTQMIKKFIERY